MDLWSNELMALGPFSIKFLGRTFILRDRRSLWVQTIRENTNVHV